MCQAAVLNSWGEWNEAIPTLLAFKGLNSVLGGMNLPKTQVQENMIIALTRVGTRCYWA